MYCFWLLLSITTIAGLQPWRTVFNNYTLDQIGITGFQILSGLYALTRNPIGKLAPVQNKKMVDKRKYWLCYLLYFLSGARRQIFGAAMAVNAYLHKISDSEDIAPFMAVGFTINHISAVIIPVAGGALWMLDSRIPFLA